MEIHLTPLSCDRGEMCYMYVAIGAKWTNRVSCIWHGTTVICAEALGGVIANRPI